MGSVGHRLQKPNGVARTRRRACIESLESRRLLSTYYVDSHSPGPTFDGSSWSSAFADLQQAMLVADGGDQVLVAGGTYVPTATIDRTISFQLKNGVALLGGYAGSNDVNPDQRDTAAFPSILSGEIGSSLDLTDNTIHVVDASGTDATASLDGFTITGGYASGTNGGGLYDVGGSPTISNCTFIANFASGYGGAMSNSSSSPNITHCVFTRNSATGGGGAISNDNLCVPSIIDCVFNGNSSAAVGGAVINSHASDVQFVNCIFTGNSAGQIAGAAESSTIANSTFINCTFVDNSAGAEGGAIDNFNQGLSTLTNCIIYNNSAPAGAQIGNSLTTIPGSATVSYSDVQGGFTGVFNFDAPPQFVQDPSAGIDLVWGTTDDNYGDLELQSTSPCIDVGNNAAVPAQVSDFLGLPRLFDFPGVHDPGPIVDLGPYEAGSMMLQAPTNVQATDGTLYSVVHVSWDAVAGADSYQIWRGTSTDISTGELIASDVTDLFYDDATALGGMPYSYRVQAFNSGSASAFSAEATGSIRPVLPPADVQASDGAFYDHIHITWDAADGADTYFVRRSTTNDPLGADFIDTSGNATVYDDFSAVAGTTYFYWVTAANSRSASDFSISDSGFAKIIPAPTNVQAGNATSFNTIEITWNPVAGADFYEVWRGLGDVPTDLLESVSGTSYVDSTFDTFAPTFFYWVKASAGGSFSDFSIPGAGSLKAPDAPTNVRASQGVFNDHIHIGWDAAAGDESYLISRDGINITPNPVMGTTYDDASIAADTLYHYSITAVGLHGLTASTASSAASGFGSDTVSPAAFMSAPQNRTTITRAALNSRHYIDIEFDDSLSGIDASSVTDAGAEFILAGSAAKGVKVNGAAVYIGNSIYRYSFTGQFGIGPVAVDMPAGTWSDNAHNPSLLQVQSFNVAQAMPGFDDPDDQMTEATALGQITWQGQSITGELVDLRDVNLYSLQAAKNQWISIRVDTFSSDIAAVRLFDSAGHAVKLQQSQGSLEAQLTKVGTYYLGFSNSGNLRYDIASGAGDRGSDASYSLDYQCTISDPVAIVPVTRGDGSSINLTIKRYTGPKGVNYATGHAIGTDSITWIVIHGRGDNADSKAMQKLAGAVDGSMSSDQVLTIDWRDGAKAGVRNNDPTDFTGEDWIQPVALAGASVLRTLGIAPQDINLVGVDWGAYVADELAHDVGGVGGIIALDAPIDVTASDTIAAGAPALRGGAYNPEGPGEINFARDSEFSWAFRADKTRLTPTVSAYLGSALTPQTASQSFFVRGADHYSIVPLFTNVLTDGRHPGANGVSDTFQLSIFMNGGANPWVEDQYDPEGILHGPDANTFEAVILASRSGHPQSISYANDDGQEVTLPASQAHQPLGF